LDKVDLKKTLSSFKAKKGQFDIINVPSFRYLAIDGENGPASTDYAAALETLYPVAYKLKFLSKANERDYVVPPLESLWWADDMSVFTTNFDKSQWLWTAMIMTPEWITNDMVDEAKEIAGKKLSPEALAKLNHITLEEGQCVQILHLGSYDNEGPTLKTLHEEFIPDNNLKMTGKHHEIYFNDFRKIAPEKLRTILRQPVVNT